MNEYYLQKTAPKLITKKMLNEIEKRQLLALKANNYSDIMDAKQKVIKIIDEEGLNSEESKVKLETALKVLPYIIPTKKAIETTVIHRKLEDIISESIEEATIIDSKTDNKDDTITEQPATNSE